jgi:hypothetical protein
LDNRHDDWLEDFFIGATPIPDRFALVTMSGRWNITELNVNASRQL